MEREGQRTTCGLNQQADIAMPSSHVAEVCPEADIRRPAQSLPDETHALAAEISAHGDVRLWEESSGPKNALVSTDRQATAKLVT
jgi:hypothetical protein